MGLVCVQCYLQVCASLCVCFFESHTAVLAARLLAKLLSLLSAR
jgi:hypothetical protein